MSTTATGTLSVADEGYAVRVTGRASVYGTGNGVWHLERSYDGETWEIPTVDLDKGTPARFAGSRSFDIDEGVDAVYYRIVLETLYSGTFTYRITSAATDVIAPVSTGSGVEIIGDGEVGDTLTLDVGDWDGVTPIDYDYQWYQAGVALSGKDEISLVVTTAMDGLALRGDVTAENIGGATTESTDTLVVA